jgi:hypothetical protein
VSICHTYRNGRPHLRRGLEAQAPHGLLGAEDRGGTLPEHVEGASRLHCECVCVSVKSREVNVSVNQLVLLLP